MPKCPICETKVSKHIETYKSDFNNQEYKLYHCPNCDLQWWEPLKMIPEFYENEGLDGYRVMHNINIALNSKHFAIKSFLNFLKQESINKTKIRILDIGCGNGVFLKNLIYYWPNKDIEIEIWGIDLDKKSIAVAQKIVPNGNFKVITLEKFKNSKEIGKFDIITFFEVLEHQDNPKEFLESIYELLENNGFIFGSVPNRERLLVSLDRKFYSKNEDFPPNHFLYFNRKSLSILLKKVGFRDIKFYNNDFDLMDIGHYIAFCLSFGILEKLKTKKYMKNYNKIVIQILLFLI